MKKVFLTAVFTMAMILSANAQDYKWFLGGELGFWSSKIGSVKTTAFNVAPEVGYNVSDNFAVATALRYGSIKTGNRKSDGFVLNPYLRYTFLKAGIVSAFIDGGITVGLSDFDGFEAGIKPGIAIALTDRLNAVAHFGFVGYNDGEGIGAYSAGKGFGIDLSGYQTQFGFYYSF
jgi:hypothetical protein